MAQSHDDQPDSGEPGLAVHILLVEDDAMLTMMLEDALESLGCTVEAAATLPDAMQMAETAEAAVALLDINVAGHPVYPVAEVLRERGIPFFFVTAYVHEGVAPEYSHVPRLHKPFHLAELEALVRRMAAGQQRDSGTASAASG